MMCNLVFRALGILVVFISVIVLSAAGVNAQEIMYGSLGGAADGADDGGAIVIISQTTGAVTVLGTPLPRRGLPGLDFNSRGQLFGTTDGGPSGNVALNAQLLEINPQNGSLIRSVGDLLYNGNPVSITDIAFQPGTDILFGSAAPGNGLQQNDLVTIDTATGSVTRVGLPAYNGNGGYKAIAFAPNGTLYAKETNAEGFWTVDPSNAAVLTSTTINPAVGSLGLGVRPSDGMLFFAECCGTFNQNGLLGNDIFSLDAASGNATFLGAAGGTRRVHDIAFLVSRPVPTMNQWGMLIFIATAGLVSAYQIMRQRRATN